METKKRFRSTLAQYRKIEHDLRIANGHIELGTKQLSDLQRKHDIQEAANKELKATLEFERTALSLCGIKVVRNNKFMLVDNVPLRSLSKNAVILAILSMSVSAYQIFHALQSL